MIESGARRVPVELWALDYVVATLYNLVLATTPCHSRTRRRRPGSASSQAVDNRHQRGHVVDIHDTAISNDATGPSVFKGGDRASFLRQLRKAACENGFPIDYTKEINGRR